MCLYTYLPTYLMIRSDLSLICPSTSLPLYLPTCLSTHLSTFLPIYLPTYLIPTCCVLWLLKFQNRLHKNAQLVPILSHINLDRSFSFYYKNNFNIILSSAPRHSKFPHQNPVRITCPPNGPHVLPTHPL